MKGLLAVAIVAAAVAGCTRTVVVEKPVPATVVERPVVVDRPVVAAAPAPQACTFGGVPYSQGATSCQSSNEFRCSEGSWVETGSRC
jgi:hypothetical protein